MTSVLRSKQGCWTCRLRKKKCDERRDICTTCESLTITCYGYGAKPDWMDGGEKERAMGNSIKQIVKHTSRRKATGRLGLLAAKFQKNSTSGSGDAQQPLEPASGPRILPKETIKDTKSHSPPASQSNSSGTTFTPETQPSPESDCGNAPSQNSPDTNHSGSEELTVPFFVVSGDESVLLMHYLDIVFYLQYPMYKSSVEDGGRGWVLSSLLRTKPLYHAALALSAYHRGALLLATQQGVHHDPENYAEQEKHLAKFFEEFQRAINRVSRFVEREPGDCMAIISCIVQLVFFELFANRGNTWQLHLKMACKKIADAHSSATVQEVLSMASAQESVPPRTHHNPKAHDIKTYKFFSGVIVWLDTISSVTSGTTPNTLPLDSVQEQGQPQLNLENIMGCESWALLEIGRISRIYELQTLSCQHDYTGCTGDGIQTLIDRIRGELVQGLAEGHMSTLNLSNDRCMRSRCTTSEKITRLFALTGLVYLHLVILGLHQGASCVDSTVRDAMTLLRQAESANFLTAVVFPLYILACVANEEDKPFFRRVFSSAPLLDPTLDHRSKMLPQLEAVWTMRNNADAVGVTWTEVLQVSNGTLLI
ncbi:Zn2/Cys6 DNA-binding protein [Glarea lozoyensis ATCC 20868]|uniref:Zn2/Cys6 DNA-binding protein n=1 Tax=Glarea lozoyensis (strain ATCC 20868 / MF5171) TaxID=1116229 RepID=S3CLS5_GLAL2|nr:Zn2/Cys6 DNA-binding protein [Glarea lozoyensis ATCC 20868]EPE27447.1 Zn2/Cys6 DNA-binding protein [Glarea lozoyensis ATCC 20868]